MSTYPPVRDYSTPNGWTTSPSSGSGEVAIPNLALTRRILANAVLDPFDNVGPVTVDGGTGEIDITFDHTKAARTWDFRRARFDLEAESWWSTPQKGDVDIFDMVILESPAEGGNTFFLGVEVGDGAVAAENRGVNVGIRWQGFDRLLVHNNQSWEQVAAVPNGDRTAGEIAKVRAIIMYGSKQTNFAMVLGYDSGDTLVQSRWGVATTNSDPADAYLSFGMHAKTVGTGSSTARLYLDHIRTSMREIAGLPAPP